MIHIYNSLSNEHISLNSTGRLGDILPNYDFKNSVAIIQGKRIDENYIVTGDEVIYIRAVPKGGTTAAIIMVVCAVVAIGVAAGAAIYATKKSDEAKEAMEKAQKDANNLAKKISSLPFLKGAKNTKALGNAVQFQMGEMFNTPYLITDGYYTIDGTDGTKQYWNAILDLGYAKQLIKNVNIGSEKIKSFDISKSSVPQEGIFSFDKSSVYYDSENVLEIRQGAEFENEFFKNKVIATQNGSEIKHDYGKALEPLVQQLATNTKKVEICIQFAALRQYNTDASTWEARTVQINPYWSNDGGATWNLFYFEGREPQTEDIYEWRWVWEDYTTTEQKQRADGTYYVDTKTEKRLVRKRVHTGERTYYNQFTRNTNYAIRYKAVKEFTYEEAFDKDIIIKLERATPKRESNSNEDCYLLYYNSFCFDRQKSFDAGELVDCSVLESDYTSKHTRIGVRIIANDSTQDTLDEINATTCAVARAWDKEKKQWSAEKYQTRNPASWILELLTSESHLHSKYEDGEIELGSFGELYEYCEENDFFCDAIITQSQKKRDIITSILQTVFANMFLNSEGKLAIVIDKKEELPVALLNSESVRSIKVAKSFERSSDGIKINFTNSESWAIDTVYTMFGNKERTEQSVLTELSMEYATTYNHIYKIAQRRMRQQLLQPRTISVDVGKEGDYYPLFSTVLLQLKELKQGIASSVIKSVGYAAGKISELEIADRFYFEDGKRYGVIIQAQGENGIARYYSEVTGDGFTNKITILDEISITESVLPQMGNTLSFGYLTDDGGFETITNVMKITGLEPNGDEGYTLELKDYNEAIYEYGEIPEYKTNLTSRPQTGDGLSDLDFGSYVQSLKDFVTEQETGVYVGNPETPSNVQAYASKEGVYLSCVYATEGLANSIKTIEYQVKKWGNDWEDVNSSSFYEFNRSIDGYPEADALRQWQFRARVSNIYGKYSEYSEAEYVNADGYGTWQLQPPNVYVRIENRLITLKLFQPERADGKELYGNIRYRVQIKRTQPGYEDSIWYKPATSADPYLSEDNYKDGLGYVISDGTYIQNMPLIGQSTDNIINTQYTFNICAENENGVSDFTEQSAVALCTNIADFVRANKDVKEEVIVYLSALCANLGTISQGALGGNSNNMWDLSTFFDEETGEHHYEGKFRVGGTEQYLYVEPILEGNKPTGEYNITFKVGNFEINSTASSISGDLYIQEDENSLDRTRITPNGTYYEHRETVAANWEVIASNNVNGVMTKQVFSNDTLYITNQDMAQRRLEGYDIGNPYLSDGSKVYHFDTDVNDQNQVNDLTIADAENDGFHELRGKETSNADLDFTPAILAVAPYATGGKSLYGRYGLSKNIGVTNCFTVDFWIQYIYAENQTLFDIGSSADKVCLVVTSAEPYFEVGEDDESGLPFNEELLASFAPPYRKLELKDCIFNSDDLDFNAPESGEKITFESPAKKEFKASYVYYEIVLIDNVRTYQTANVGAANYYEKLKEGLYERAIAFNTPNPARSYIRHYNAQESEEIDLSDLEISFNSNEWLHIGFVLDQTDLRILLNDVEVNFETFGSVALSQVMELNLQKGSFLLDELMIDGKTAESSEMFFEHTTDRIPWAALPKSNEYFVLTVADLKNFKTNIFDTELFKQKVLEIINEYHNS